MRQVGKIFWMNVMFDGELREFPVKEIVMEDRFGGFGGGSRFGQNLVPDLPDGYDYQYVVGSLVPIAYRVKTR